MVKAEDYTEENTHTHKDAFNTVSGAERQEANVPKIRVLHSPQGLLRNSCALLTRLTVN